MRRLALVGFLIAVTACGGAKQGGSCNTDGFACADNSTALQCYGGAWVALPCRGPDGCKRNGDSISCDMSTNQVGDACATTVDERSGVCQADGKALLQCRDRVLTVTEMCRECGIVNGTVKCQP